MKKNLNPFKEKIKVLTEIYEQFETQACEYKKDAVCKAGCAFCCTQWGSVDIITLEGLVIQEYILALPPLLQTQIRKKLLQNKQDKENQNVAPCPFLKADDTCLIYDIRPFSCRQLYSLKKCGESGPVIHRQAAELAKAAIRKIQQLDDTGYSGHISFILYLLDKPGFREFYVSGGFEPAQIMDFGKTHGIVINRSVGLKN